MSKCLKNLQFSHMNDQCFTYSLLGIKIEWIGIKIQILFKHTALELPFTSYFITESDAKILSIIYVHGLVKTIPFLSVIMFIYGRWRTFCWPNKNSQKFRLQSIIIRLLVYMYIVMYKQSVYGTNFGWKYKYLKRL